MKKETAEVDKCVMCGTPTYYSIDTHIDDRMCYVEGAGQLCNNCYNKIYDEK
jgi:hypothetical protein